MNTFRKVLYTYLFMFYIQDYRREFSENGIECLHKKLKLNVIFICAVLI